MELGQDQQAVHTLAQVHLMSRSHGLNSLLPLLLEVRRAGAKDPQLVLKSARRIGAQHP